MVPFLPSTGSNRTTALPNGFPSKVTIPVTSVKSLFEVPASGSFCSDVEQPETTAKSSTTEFNRLMKKTPGKNSSLNRQLIATEKPTRQESQSRQPTPIEQQT
jgi:hypothetical protein